MNPLSVEAYLTGINLLSSLCPVPIASIAGHEHYVLFCLKNNANKNKHMVKKAESGNKPNSHMPSFS